MRDFKLEANSLRGLVQKRTNTEEKPIKETIICLLQSIKREGMSELIDYILSNTDYFTAPASTRFHGNIEGGLAEHSLNVYVLLSSKNKMYHLGLSEESIILCALLHDLCKANFYTIEFKNKKVYSDNGSKSDSNGRFDWETVPAYGVDDKFPLGHGEKSLSIIQDYIKLSDTEKMLIRWHMGPFSSIDQYGFNNAAEYEPAICAIYTADMEASMLYEETIK